MKIEFGTELCIMHFLYEGHKWDMWFRLGSWIFVGLKREAGK